MEAKGQLHNKIATLVPGSEIPRGTPSSGGVQWQDDAVNKGLDHTLVTLHGLKPTPAAVGRVVLGPTPTTTSPSLQLRSSHSSGESASSPC